VKKISRYTLGELSRLLDTELHGDGEIEITGLASIESAGPADLTFLSNPRLVQELAQCKAGAVILQAQHADNFDGACLVAEQPYLVYARVSRMFAEADPAAGCDSGIHSTAVISENTTIGHDVSIGPHVVIEAGVTLGDGVMIGANSYIGRDSRVGERCRLYPGVVIYHGVTIGRNTILHSGVVIGGDGFGFAFDGRRSEKIAQLGGVQIGDDVEIGAGSTVDRGAINDTIIEEGVKIDNQVQIAHNCFVGAHSVICGCTGMAGSARLGRYCSVGGGVGIIGHVSIADHTVISARSFVNRAITEPGMYSSGSVLQPGKLWKKNAVRQSQLDDMARRLRELERKISE
jgi:UDP-3-O-[3-hydroxymyristoyl] glucosamine N-acyltransferase